MPTNCSNASASSSSASNYPATLSGGMKQRIALLRTVLFNPSFLARRTVRRAGRPDAPLTADVAARPVGARSTPASSSSRMTCAKLSCSPTACTSSARARPASRASSRSICPRPRLPEHLALPQARVQLEQELVSLLMKEQQS